MKSMRRDVWRRVRWPNVALAAAIALVPAAVVIRPPAAPSLPADTPRPLVSEGWPRGAESAGAERRGGERVGGATGAATDRGRGAERRDAGHGGPTDRGRG